MGKHQLMSTGEEVVPTYTLAAAFAIALVMGLAVVSGVVFKPYDAKLVVEELHQRILYEKEMRELRRLTGETVVRYAPQVVSETADANYFPESSYAVKPATPVSPASDLRKTERAENFERDIRSDDYWTSLQASIRKAPVAPASEPVVIPPVIVGAAN